MSLDIFSGSTVQCQIGGACVNFCGVITQELIDYLSQI